MAKIGSPFSGIKLTDQTPLKGGGLDQRLFTPAAPPPPASPAHPPQPSATPASESPTEQVAPVPSSPASSGQQPARERPAAKSGTVRTNIRTSERTNERPIVRTNIRHSFDCWADQLLTLRQIAMDREVLVGERVTLGDLVKEALDRFIATERSNERTEK